MIAFRIGLGILVCGLIVACMTFRNIANDLSFVTSGASKTEIHQYFESKGKTPVFVYRKGDCPQVLGWKLPEKKIDFELEVYDSSLAVRIYVYLGMQLTQPATRCRISSHYGRGVPQYVC